MNKIQIYKDLAGYYRWRLIASNGEIVCWSEGYSSLQNAEKSAIWLKNNSSKAEIIFN